MNKIVFALNTSKLSFLGDSVAVMGTQGNRARTPLMKVSPGEQMLDVGGSTELQIVVMDGDNKIITDSISLMDGTSNMTGTNPGQQQQLGNNNGCPSCNNAGNQLQLSYPAVSVAGGGCCSCNNNNAAGCASPTGGQPVYRIDYNLHIITSYDVNGQNTTGCNNNMGTGVGTFNNNATGTGVYISPSHNNFTIGGTPGLCSSPSSSSSSSTSTVVDSSAVVNGRQVLDPNDPSYAMYINRWTRNNAGLLGLRAAGKRQRR